MPKWPAFHIALGKSLLFRVSVSSSVNWNSLCHRIVARFKWDNISRMTNVPRFTWGFLILALNILHPANPISWVQLEWLITLEVGKLPGKSLWCSKCFMNACFCLLLLSLDFYFLTDLIPLSLSIQWGLLSACCVQSSRPCSRDMEGNIASQAHLPSNDRQFLTCLVCLEPRHFMINS